MGVYLQLLNANVNGKKKKGEYGIQRKRESEHESEIAKGREKSRTNWNL